jgi:hypothetical protein
MIDVSNEKKEAPKPTDIKEVNDERPEKSSWVKDVTKVMAETDDQAIKFFLFWGSGPRGKQMNDWKFKCQNTTL